MAYIMYDFIIYYLNNNLNKLYVFYIFYTYGQDIGQGDSREFRELREYFLETIYNI